MEDIEEKVVWKDVHEQNALFIGLFVKVGEVLSIYQANGALFPREKLVVLSSDVLAICNKHKTVCVSNLPNSDKEVSSEDYMVYFNAFSVITDCITELEKVFNQLSEKGAVK